MQTISLSQLSMVGGSGIEEAKVPLWWADGTDVYSGWTTSGSGFLEDGVNGMSGTATPLFTLSSGWPINLQFAFETSFYTTYSGYAAYVALWDVTSASIVSISQVSTTSSTEIVLRSNKFTLVPGHSYDVTLWIANSSYNCRLSDASLIVFL